MEATSNEWTINWDDCDGLDIPGEQDLLEIFVDIVHGIYMK